MAMILRKLQRWQAARRAGLPGGIDRALLGDERLVNRLAETLYRHDLNQGGWVAEVGSVGPAMYRNEASWILQEVSLGTAQNGPPTP